VEAAMENIFCGSTRSARSTFGILRSTRSNVEGSPRPQALSRRDLLKTGGAVIVSFAFDALVPRSVRGQTNTDAAKPLDPSEVDSFLAIHADGTVTVYTGKVDVGTGLRIAVAQMAAEELGIPAGRIKMVDGDTALCPDQGGTGGSTGLTRGGAEVRQAAATARQTLVALGAARLNRPAAELTIADGAVRPLGGGAGIGIGALVGERRLSLKVDPKAPLREPARYSVVGQPLPRPDVPDKCTGRHVYVQDFTLPGMLHARVIHPPSVGATLVSVDESSLRGIPDVRLVRIANFVAVVARRAEGDMDRLAGAPRQRGARSVDACGCDRARPGDRHPGWRRRGGTRRRREEIPGDVLLAVSKPCVARTIVRRRGRAR
jgi:hypothetical protein